MEFTKIQPIYGDDGTLEFHQLGPRRWAPRRFVAHGDAVSLLIQLDSDGTPRCLEACVRGDSLTSDSLRLPLARLVREAVAGASFSPPAGVDAAPTGGGSILAGILSRDRSDLEFREDYTSRVRKPRRGAPITDEFLADVATAYRAALERGEPPTEAVKDEMHAGRSTAARWVALARQRGLLGPSMRGRAGEATIDTTEEDA